MRKEPSKTTYKELFALSGNVCAFPGCKQKMFEENHNLIGQICHIEAAEPSGERYNPHQTDKERAGFDNLILLCANHHSITNDVSKYSIEKLKAMKKSHEDRFRDHQYLIDPAELNRILSLLDEKVARISKLEDEIKLNSKPRLEMKVDVELILVSNGLRLLGISGMNTGDLPITLSHWGFGLPNGDYITGFPYLLPEPVTFPYKLLPGESLTVAMEFTRIVATLKTAGYPNTICLRGYFQDQLKKQYDRMTEPFNFYLK